ncbi:fasciclin domain-containing protein [Salinarimonas ramus]|uniref:Fasciclin n=1 Tax=Salinarimonas ramus TaxID=690164 RepID=A0A917V2M8_9HYPH|nr:fasciclin domain-containing protein [Salinarimonas ramus]GGK23961.1 fasciclin [Salinarimonas ramus]
MSKTLKNLASAAALGAVLSLGAGAASAQAVKTVGGAPMFPTRTIVENAVNSADHTTLVAAVQAAGLADTLSGPGPFTVFAPTNRAFSRLPAGTVDTLLEPQNRGQLTDVLTFHVVPGTYTAAELLALAQRSDGQAELTTVEGGTLAVLLDRNGNGPYIADNQGNTARVPIADVMQSNGVIHVIDKVMLP